MRTMNTDTITLPSVPVLDSVTPGLRSPYRALAVEMAAHSAVPYRMVTPTPDGQVIAEMGAFPGVFEQEYGWTLLDRFPHPVPKAELVGRGPVTDMFRVLHGATRHSSPLVRRAAYATVQDMALAASRRGHRAPHVGSPDDPRLGRDVSGFWGLGFLIGHALADPEPGTVLAPLFDYPLPDRPPEIADRSDSGWVEQPARYWAELITALLRGTNGGTFRERYPDIRSWWKHLDRPEAGELLRDGRGMTSTAPLKAHQQLHHHWEITTTGEDGNIMVLMRRPGCFTDQTIYHTHGTIAVPLLRAFAARPDQAHAFHQAISEMPIHAWQRWVFHQPYLHDTIGSLGAASRAGYLLGPQCPDRATGKFWHDLLDWVDSAAEFLAAEAGEDYGYVLRNAPGRAGRYALDTMSDPLGVALAYPALWFSRWVPERVGERLVGRYIREADVSEHQRGEHASSLRSGVMGAVPDLWARAFNDMAVRAAAGGNPDGLLRNYRTARNGITAGTAPSENFSRVPVSAG